MTDSSNNNVKQLCCCGSGLEDLQCCGVEGRTALNAAVYAYVTQEGVSSEHELTPEMKLAIDTVSENPGLFPARVNLFSDKAWFIKMSPSTYSESVFLDPARMKGTCLVESDVEWLADICEKIQWQPTSFIFHSAFCGSTLISQILEKAFNCLSLREPELLGSMLIYNRSQVADEKKDFWFENLQKLLSRRYAKEQPVIIKANDFANPLIRDLIQWKSNIPVLFMYTPLKEFITACLKADNRREWIKQRYDSVKRNLPDTFELNAELEINGSNTGEMAAAYWSYNMTNFLKVVATDYPNIKSLDFNDMLASPLKSVEECKNLFGLKSKPDIDLEQAVNDLMSVYSKNSKFRYSPEQRREDLNRQLELFTNELEAGEKVAHQLLKDDYPRDRLPNSLLGS